MTIQLTIECDEDTPVADEEIKRIILHTIQSDMAYILERKGIEILWHKTRIHRDDDE